MSTQDSTPPPGESPPQNQPFLIQSAIGTRGWLNTCPHAQTLTAFSTLLDRRVVIALPCKQWSCRHCAQVKICTLAIMTREAKPNRMLTLTVDPSKFSDPRAAFDGTRRQVPELIRYLRTKFGEVEYLRVTEITKAGWPHYHLLVRSGFLPHKVVKDTWTNLTGAVIVDLRQVKDHFNAYGYLVKYLTKLHRIEWTERHVSHSKHFFPKPIDEGKPSLELQDLQRVHLAPWNYLHQFHKGEYVKHWSTSVFTLEGDLFFNREDCGEPPASSLDPLDRDDRHRRRPGVSAQATLPNF